MEKTGKAVDGSSLIGIGRGLPKVPGNRFAL
jgi:hypothetical protein